MTEQPTDYVNMTDIHNHLQSAGIPADLHKISPGGYFWLFVGDQIRTTGPGEPVHAPILATGGRLADDGHIRADVDQFRYNVYRGGGYTTFFAHSSDGTYHLTAQELAEHMAEILETTPNLAGLCRTCGGTVTSARGRWNHLAESTQGHIPSPRFRTVAQADVWDFDDATAHRYLR